MVYYSHAQTQEIPMTPFRIKALTAGGQHIASETIEADASDTALHQMAERHPTASKFEAQACEHCNGHGGRCDQVCCWCGDEKPPLIDHNGMAETVPMWQYRRYLDAVRTFMRFRAEKGESPTKTLGASNGTWAHQLMDRLLEVADDPGRCKRETERLEEQIAAMRRESVIRREG